MAHELGKDAHAGICLLSKSYSSSPSLLLDALDPRFGLASGRVPHLDITTVVRDNDVEAVRLGKAVKPVCGKVRAADCVLNTTLTGASAEESAGSPRGDGAFEVEAEGTAMFFKVIKLGTSVHEWEYY